jgi:hypothetical protein
MINHLNHQMSNSNNTVPSNGTSDQRGRNITTGLFGLSNEIIRIIFYTKVCNIMSDIDIHFDTTDTFVKKNGI